MKKLLFITLAIVVVVILCLGMTACGTNFFGNGNNVDADKIVETLTNEFGALLEGGKFVEGSVFNLDEINISEEKATEVFDVLEDSGITISDTTKAYIYDIFVTKDNYNVQPNETVKVTIPAPKDDEAEGYKVYHVKDSGAVESIPATLEDGKIIFETDGFSVYLLTPTYNCVVGEIVHTGNLSVYMSNPTYANIQCNGQMLRRKASTRFAGTYVLGEDTILDVMVKGSNDFVGWFEVESDSNENPEKLILKETPISTETTYIFNTSETEYVVYAVFVANNQQISFDVNDAIYGCITIDGEQIENGYSEKFTVGKSYSLGVKAYEGYRFVCWEIIGDISDRHVEEENFEFVTTLDESKVIAIFTPVVIDISVDMADIVYNPSLIDEYELIGISEFKAICEEGKTSENWNNEYMVVGKIKRIDNPTYGNMYITDEVGNSLHLYGVYGEDGTLFENLTAKPEVGDVIAVHGKPYKYIYEPEMKKAYLLNALPVLPDFTKAIVTATTPEYNSKLYLGEYTVDTTAINSDKAGEYEVVYTYVENPEIEAFVKVTVVATPIEFSVWVNGGTFIYDGVNIGSDYCEIFTDGFGKVTLTAKGEENTVFKGWFEIVNNDNNLVSLDTTYTFEFDDSIRVYAQFDYVATELYIDGHNMGFDTYRDYTEIYLPLGDQSYNLNSILVFAIINGERELLNAEDYTINADGFDGNNPQKGNYEVTFTYNENPELKVIHTIRVLDEENIVSLDVSVDAGGRVILDKNYYQYNKGEQIIMTVKLRSEKDYDFLGWYSVVYGETEDTSSETLISMDRTYVLTLEESMQIEARVEPKITYLEVEGYEGEPTRINITKFWMADRDFTVYACGALGKKVELNSDEYSVDFGGLDIDNPVVGKYVITYTYLEDTTITYSVTVLVWEEDFSFFANAVSPNGGQLLHEGNINTEVGGQYIKGEEVSITAIANDNYTFVGWYLVINHDTHCEYELLSLDYTYTFVIGEDTQLEARFDMPYTSIDLSGINSIVNGEYTLTVYNGDVVDLSTIGVWAKNSIESVNLNVDEYTVDLGGLNVDEAVAGIYNITYTYKENPDLTIDLIVNVLKYSYYLHVEGERGYFECNGVKTFRMYEKFEDGTKVVLKAVDFDTVSRVFIGWYEFNYETGEWELLSSERNISITIDRDRQIYAQYDFAIIELEITNYENLYQEGVHYFNLNEQCYFDGENSYNYKFGSIDISLDSKYAEDFVSMFEELNLLAINCNGQYKFISYEDLTFDLGDYIAMEGWYLVTITYGNVKIEVNVCVTQAENAQQ